MEKEIENAVKAFGMEKAYGKIIIGFSGGADSSALVHYFSKRAKEVVCVHVNHMIRGKEALRDEKFCKEVCAKYGVEFVSYKIDIPKIAKEKSQGIELTARDERYKVLYSELEKRNFDAILTAHNSDDNVETVLFNLSRGSGLNGLCGINPVSDKVLRPLIYCTKEQIVGYCDENGIEYVIDSTNSDTDYTRNYLRHKVVPLLKNLNPSLDEAIVRLCSSLRTDCEFVDAVCDDFIKNHCENGKIDTKSFALLHKSVKVRVLKKISGENIDYTVVNSCIELSEKSSCGAMLDIGYGLCFKKEHDYLCFIKAEEKENKEFCYVLKNGTNEIPECEITVSVNGEITGKKAYCVLDFDSKKIKGKMFVRNRIEGDTVICGKMEKKLKKIFTEKHIPSHIRGKIPILCDENGIIAVPCVCVRDGLHMKINDLRISFYENKCSLEDKL